MASFTDNFDRANGAIGSNWTEHMGGFDIITNKARGDTVGASNRSYCSVATATTDFTADHSAEIVVSSLNSGDSVGVVVRASASGCYIAKSYGAAGLTCLIKFDGTTFTALDATTWDVDDGDVIKLTAVGSTITAYKNAVQVVQVTDTTYTDGQPGMFYEWDNTGGSRADDFSAGDINTASLTVTQVGGDNEVYSAEADFGIVGTGLSAGQTFTISGVACTELSFSSSTSVKLTAPNFISNNIRFGKREFKVTD